MNRKKLERKRRLVERLERDAHRVNLSMRQLTEDMLGAGDHLREHLSDQREIARETASRLNDRLREARKGL